MAFNLFKNKNKPMDKKEALKRLASIEDETKKLRAIIDAPVNIIDRIKSYEDACEYLEIETTLPYPNPKNNRQESSNAFHMLDIITEALLEGKTLNWEDSNEKKWYPWFNEYKSGSGFRFDCSYYDWSYTNFNFGARLCVDTKEKSDYLGTHFLPLINKLLNPVK